MLNYVLWNHNLIRDNKEFQLLNIDETKIGYCKSTKKAFFITNNINKGFVELIELNKNDTVYVPFYYTRTNKELLNILSCFCIVNIFTDITENDDTVTFIGQVLNKFYFPLYEETELKILKEK